MRSFILVLASAFVLVFCGIVYFWMQPVAPRKVYTDLGPSTSMSMETNDSGMPMGAGENIELKKYDQLTGELSTEFIISEYKPQKGNRVAVKNATARFYMSNSQIVQIHGKTGLFAGDNSSRTTGSQNGAPKPSAPTRGWLKDVTLEILDNNRVALMTITMNNASFDSETSTIFTEGYVDPVTHQDIPADQVKVTIRSAPGNPNGYDFDGKGLRLNWNERDHRLAKLDIAHGEKLIINNPKSMNTTVTTSSNGAETGVEASLLATVGKPDAVAASNKKTGATDKALATGPNSAASVAPGKSAGKPAGNMASRKLSPNTDPPIFRAVFSQNVRIVQEGADLVLADRMTVDFWMSSGDPTLPITGESTSPRGKNKLNAGNDQAQSNVPIELTGKPTDPALAGKAPATKPDVALNSGPDKAVESAAPLIVFWNGPLHVEPYPQGTAKLGDSLISLEGTPVVATMKQSEIKAGKLEYRTEDGRIKGFAMPGGQIDMVSDSINGKTTIHTTGIEFRSKDANPTVLLLGKSSAELPVKGGDPAGAGGAAKVEEDKLLASWTERCLLRFETAPGGQLIIRHADIDGDVKISHPQMKLDSKRMELAFDIEKPNADKDKPVDITAPTVPQSVLRRLVATDGVRCIMKDQSDHERTITSKSLTLLTDTADGKLYPRTVNADGDVHTLDFEQEMWAGHLAVTLAPPGEKSSQPAATGIGSSVDLKSMIADDHVHVLAVKDQTEAFADTMLVDKKNGKPTVKFVGQPNAKIIQKGNTILGPVLDLIPDSQAITVAGAGSMQGVQQSATSATTRPIDVSWTRHLKGNGKDNLIELEGAVIAKTVDPDGTVNRISGDQATIVLEDVPSAADASSDNSKTGPTTKPSDPADTKVATADSPQQTNKGVRKVTFDGNTSVSSLLEDAKHQPLRRMNLRSKSLIYEVISPSTRPTTQSTTSPANVASAKQDMASLPKRITVPGAGQMLFEDYRGAEQAAANVAEGIKPNDAKLANEVQKPEGKKSEVGVKGATAFQWQDKLVYDDLLQQAVMNGGVIIDHRDDVQKEESIHLTADSATAELDSTSASGGQSTGVQVKKFGATGNIIVTLRGGELKCHTVTFDPKTKILTARGSNTTDAIFTRNGAGLSQPLRAEEMQWDAASDLPKVTKISAQYRR